jgi:hypothetical protein
LRGSATTDLYIVGEDNKSWLARIPDETTSLALQIINIAENNGRSALISNERAESNTQTFIKQFLIPEIQRKISEGKDKTKQKILSSFTYSLAPEIKYKAVLADDKLVLLPCLMSPDFRDEAMVIELDKANQPVEYEHYYQDIKRIVYQYSRVDKLQKMLNEV